MLRTICPHESLLISQKDLRRILKNAYEFFKKIADCRIKGAAIIGTLQ